MFGMKQEVIGKLYNREDCKHCQGKPPVGYSCVYCLSYGEVPDPQPYSALVDRWTEIDLGDTNELDPCWDKLMETTDLLSLARMGMPNVVISRLVRIAVDATKGR